VSLQQLTALRRQKTLLFKASFDDNRKWLRQYPGRRRQSIPGPSNSHRKRSITQCGPSRCRHEWCRCWSATEATTWFNTRCRSRPGMTADRHEGSGRLASCGKNDGLTVNTGCHWRLTGHAGARRPSRPAARPYCRVKTLSRRSIINKSFRLQRPAHRTDHRSVHRT